MIFGESENHGWPEWTIFATGFLDKIPTNPLG